MCRPMNIPKVDIHIRNSIQVLIIARPTLYLTTMDTTIQEFTYCFDIQALCSKASSALPILLLKKSMCFLNWAIPSRGALCWKDRRQICKKRQCKVIKIKLDLLYMQILNPQYDLVYKMLITFFFSKTYISVHFTL